MRKRDTSTQKMGNSIKNQTLVFKPLIASSLALALGVSVGYAQNAGSIDQAYAGWYKPASVTMSSNSYAAAYTNGMFEPWDNSSSEIIWSYSKRIPDSGINGDGFQLKAKDAIIKVKQGAMIDVNNQKITFDLIDSCLRFETQGKNQGEHFLRALNGRGYLNLNFNGGKGQEVLNNITWKNIAFYGGIVMVSNYTVTDTINFQHGASMIGNIRSLASTSYGKSNITFTGGGNLIAISEDFYINNSDNIKDQAIYIKLNNNLSGDVSNKQLMQTYKFGVEGKVEVANADNLNEEGIVNTQLTSSDDATVVAVAPDAINGKKIITNIIKGNISISGYQTQQAVANIYFYNNGIIDGGITFASNADMNVYFAHEGIIRSDLNLALGGDGSRGKGLVIKKTESDDLVDKLTFDGSITTLTSFSARAKNLVLLGHKDSDGNMTTGNTLNVSSSGGNLNLIATEQADVNVGKIQNTGGRLTLNLTGSQDSVGDDISFTSNDITVNGGTTTLTFNLSNSNAQQIGFSSGNITTTSGVFELALSTSNATGSAAFNMDNISNAGSMNFNYSTTTAPITFRAGNVTNSNNLTFNFGNSSMSSLDFKVGYISNTGTITFAPPSSGSVDFVAKGIKTTGIYGTNSTTTLTLGSKASLAAGYIVTSTSNGATGANLVTTLNATAASGKNLILSAIDLSQDKSAETLTFNGVGEDGGIASGTGKYVLFAGKGTKKQEIQLNFDNTNQSYGLVLGDIYTYNGVTNTLVLKDAGSADTKLDFLGNIQSAGNTNVYFENTLWAPTNVAEMISPSAYALDPSQTTAIVNILKYINTSGTGKVTTTAGTTNLIVNTSNINLGKTPAMYQVDSSTGGNVNIAIKGATNIGAGIKYNTNTNQAVNLIFAATTAGSFSSSSGANASSNQFFGLTFQDGVKLTLQDYKVSSLDGKSTSFLDKARGALGIDSNLSDLIFSTKRTSQANSNSGQDYTDTIAISGVAVGTISRLTPSSGGSNDTYTFNVTLTKDSIFAGNIDLHGASKSIEITMEQGAKIFASNNRLVVSKLVLDPLTEHDSTTLLQNSFAQQNTTIDLATSGNDFANIAQRDTFNLLAIGNESDSGNVAGLHGNNALFRVYVNPEAPTGGLGGQTADKTGNTGADRVIILSGKGGKQYVQAIYNAHTNVSNIAYHGGGTETDGNIAVATVRSGTGITIEGARQIQGFDLIETALTSALTDVTGNSNGVDKNYTTYFLESVLSTGASPINADTTASAMGLNYNLFLANFNSLNKRMGELRDNHHSQGAWGRVFNGMLTTSYGLETKSLYTTVQVGYDYAFGFEGANNYLGIALSYANSMSDSKKMLDYDGVEKGIDNAATNGVEVALYNSYVEDSGWFNDAIFKFSYMMSNLEIAGQASSYDTNNYGIVLSDEFGYRFKLGNDKEWFIDPQVELGFGYFNQSDLKQVLGEASLDGAQDAIMTLRARIGANWAYDFKRFTQGKGINASVYVGTYYSYDYISGGDISLTTNLGKNTKLTPFASTGRFELNVGTNLEVQNNTRIYFDFEKSFGGTITTEYQVNVGVRYSFGENYDYIPSNDTARISAPLKVSDENTQESETKESVENTQESPNSEANTQEQPAKQNTNSAENNTEEKAQ